MTRTQAQTQTRARTRARVEAEVRARDWCDAWNRRDLEAVLAHYGEDVEVCSPLVVARLGRADGVLRGKDALRAYFATGMTNSALHFTFEDVRPGVNAMVVFYRRENDMRVADCCGLDDSGLIVRMSAAFAGGVSDV